MSFKVIGVIEYIHQGNKKLKIAGKRNGETIFRDTIHPNEKLTLKRVRDIAAKEMKVKTKDVDIPKHIEVGLKKKE